MRRKISLYIANRLVDLDDESFILYNYTLEDLTNPTIVKNTYSQQITLKGTPGNNAIFGDAWRLDRRIGKGGGQAGADFNPCTKTPFTIYNDTGDILESGYVKLDSVSKTGSDIEYKVTLYGGLGSFLYALSYDEEGNKRTLADLDYMGTGSPATELNFTINASSIQDAWNRLENAEYGQSMWDVINFAPAYNGCPDGNFSADKGLISPAQVGLKKSITQNSKTYTTKSDYALVNLSQEQDEWATKDMRSYLQRPVLSVKALINAIANKANNGGYYVNKAVLDDSSKFGYGDMWMTLPMLPSIVTSEQSGDLTLSFSSSQTTGKAVGRYTINGSVPSGTKVTANLIALLRIAASSSETQLLRSVTRQADRLLSKIQSVIFCQAVAYASDNTIVGGSKVKTYYDGNLTGEEIASKCGYTPLWQDESTYDSCDSTKTFSKVGNMYAPANPLTFSVEALDVAYYVIYVTSYKVYESGYIGMSSTITNVTGGTTSVPILYKSYTGAVDGSGCTFANVIGSVSYTSSSSLRSGALVTKDMLLSTSKTPADYLLSFCKMFGLYMLYDSSAKSVTILRRNDLYQDDVIDLSKRVDVSKGITIQPFAFSSKWYDFKLEGVGGAYYDEYLSVYGREYGMQRVNTGYVFNTEANNVMDSLVFKSACSVCGKSRYNNIIIDAGTFIPSPFLDKGNTYTLWNADGETLDTDISCPPSSANVTYLNNDHFGYDKVARLELCDADRKPVDGENVLLIHQGSEAYSRYKLTDDLPAMDVLNDGVPCWILDPPSDDSSLVIPTFSGYQIDNRVVNRSLDFGLPKELDIPGVKYDADKTIYAKQWKRYLSDRYNINTKVMTCHVDLSGLQVNSNLLRCFFWYGNSIWVLNSIKNYSLTTYDPVECEFVQVQKKDNYLNGQK